MKPVLCLCGSVHCTSPASGDEVKVRPTEDTAEPGFSCFNPAPLQTYSSGLKRHKQMMFVLVQATGCVCIRDMVQASMEMKNWISKDMGTCTGIQPDITNHNVILVPIC